MSRRGALLFALILAAATAHAEPAELAVLTYNIHGLPDWIARDDPPARIPQILAKATPYDVVLLQEDFSYQPVVDASHRHTHLWRGNGASLGGLGEGAGLTILSRFASDGAPLAVPYGVCNGWISAANDCLADKGYLHVRLALPGGRALDVWNTHLDAGRDAADHTARVAQLDALAAAIEARSAGRTLLAGGDFNLEWNDARDRALLERFAQRLGLSIAAQTPAGAWDGHLDYLLVRSAGDRCVEPTDAGKDEAFLDAASRPLSDHPAIRARLRLGSC